VCIYYCRTYYKAVGAGGRRSLRVDDLWRVTCDVVTVIAR